MVSIFTMFRPDSDVTPLPVVSSRIFFCRPGLSQSIEKPLLCLSVVSVCEIRLEHWLNPLVNLEIHSGNVISTAQLFVYSRLLLVSPSLQIILPPSEADNLEMETDSPEELEKLLCELRGSPQMVQLLSEYVLPTPELRVEEESSHKDYQTSQRCQNQNRATEGL
ncbi:hypothetical protein RvY_07240 [Ramazzottius varieornatus]|uniref:Uncharacterized protein n=1 Tax=Ramazzottius varieornatus TaxID=947166 RepID=A0A1D1V7K8_RAMVA|nr:hypothetical protein RvY_07240 [Ramazzottius varieornatus]